MMEVAQSAHIKHTRVFLHAAQEKKYEVKKRRVLRGKSVPHYAAVEPQGKGLMLASEKPFAFTHVDGVPVERPDPEPMEVVKTGGSQELLLITWLLLTFLCSLARSRMCPQVLCLDGTTVTCGSVNKYRFRRFLLQLTRLKKKNFFNAS